MKLEIPAPLKHPPPSCAEVVLRISNPWARGFLPSLHYNVYAGAEKVGENLGLGLECTENHFSSRIRTLDAFSYRNVINYG